MRLIFQMKPRSPQKIRPARKGQVMKENKLKKEMKGDIHNTKLKTVSSYQLDLVLYIKKSHLFV